jgi:tetratricopeptide (TPR) repeat protein
VRRGWAARSLTWYPQAAEHYERALALRKEGEAAECQARVDRLRGDFQRAEELGTMIRQQSPDDPAPRHELGCLLLRLGKPQDALHWFQTALAKDPGHRPTHKSLAEFYEQAGDQDRAAHHREALHQLSPER